MNFMVLGLSKQTIQRGKSDVRSRKTHKIQQIFNFQSSNKYFLAKIKIWKSFVMLILATRAVWS